MKLTHLAVVFAAINAVASHAATFVLSAPTWGDAQNAAVVSAGGSVRFSHAGSGVAVVQSEDARFLASVLRGGAITSGTEDVTVQWQTPLAAPEASFVEAAVNPADDTRYGLQWAPKAIEAPAAWALGFDGTGVRVAVIDGGVYAAHVDLAANMTWLRRAPSWHPIHSPPPP